MERYHLFAQLTVNINKFKKKKKTFISSLVTSMTILTLRIFMKTGLTINHSKYDKFSFNSSEIKTVLP